MKLEEKPYGGDDEKFIRVERQLKLHPTREEATSFLNELKNVLDKWNVDEISYNKYEELILIRFKQSSVIIENFNYYQGDIKGRYCQSFSITSSR